MKADGEQGTRLFRFIMLFIGISGCFSVLFGAWLAHAGQALPINEQVSLASAQKYQMYHTLALLGCVAYGKYLGLSSLVKFTCIAFMLGIVLFSVTIYFKLLLAVPFVGKVTPFGGMLFALGWLALAFEGRKKL